MFELTKFFSSIFISSIILFLFFKFKIDSLKISRKKNNFLIFFLILVIILEYWILGPHSYIKFYDEADTGLSRILYDIHNNVKGSFSHNILGGSDHYASQLLGGQHLSFERFLFYVFPVWIGLFIHKFFLVGINFLGFYNLLRKIPKLGRLQSVLFSVFPVIFNPYATSSTLQHGMGYALIPLCLYVFFKLSNKTNYFIYTSSLALLVALSISLTHSFLVLISGLFLSLFFLKTYNYKKLLVSLFLLILIVAANWSEAILGFYEYGKITERMSSGEQIKISVLGSLPSLWYKTNICISSCKIQFSPLIIILLIVSIISIINNFKKNLKYLLFLFSVIYFPIIVILLIKILNLNFLKSLNYSNISLFISVPLVLLAVNNYIQNEKQISKYILALFIFFGSLVLFDKKFEASKNILEGQQISKIINIENLKQKNLIQKNFKVASVLPYYYFHPNFSWIYDLESIDGYVNLAQRNLTIFWQCGLFNNDCTAQDIYDRGSLYLSYYPFKNPFSRKLVFDENKNILIDEMIDINMLKLVNTKYILSFHPINSENVKIVSAPKKNFYQKNFERRIFSSQRNKNIYKESLKESLLSIFKTRDIYIYTIPQTSDKAFFPNKIIKLEDDKFSSKYSFISKNYKKNTLFTNLENLNPSSGNINKITKIKNGYSYNINVKKDGILVFNNFFNTYWKLKIDGKQSEIINLNDYQMGAFIKKDNRNIELIYSRPTLINYRENQ